MPESGDIEVLSPPRIHLASRRRFDLKLDLASALSGRERVEKRPRLDILSGPASILSSSVSCGSCMGQSAVDDSPVEPPHGGLGGGQSSSAAACTFRTISSASQEERTCGEAPLPGSSGAFRAISSSELAAKLRKARPVLVIDCRPFLCYNSHHVQGAVNISCTDRFNRKRLQQGKVGVLDLLAATHGKDHFRRRHIRDVVLYDDRNSGQHVLDTDSALNIVLTTLYKEGRQPAILQGESVSEAVRGQRPCRKAQRSVPESVKRAAAECGAWHERCVLGVCVPVCLVL